MKQREAMVFVTFLLVGLAVIAFATLLAIARGPCADGFAIRDWLCLKQEDQGQEHCAIELKERYCEIAVTGVTSDH